MNLSTNLGVLGNFSMRSGSKLNFMNSSVSEYLLYIE